MVEIRFNDLGLSKSAYGEVCKDMNEMNYYMSNFMVQNHISVEDCRSHVRIIDYLGNIVRVFLLYDDMEVKFAKGNAAGAYFTNMLKAAKSKGQEIPKIKNAKKYGVRGKQIWIDNRYYNQRVKCWAYDINSAYPYALLQDLPDTTKDLGPGIVQEGEFGIHYDKGVMEESKVGELAINRFKMVESYLADWAKKQSKKKQEARKKGDDEAAEKYKASMNVAIGCLRNRDPFLYQFILWRVKDNIYKYIDEDTIRVDTDCIFSKKPRTDIPLGERLGEFKECPQNGTEILLKGASYEWGDKKSLRGVPTELQDTYDLETGVQIREPDYVIEGGQICQYIPLNK